jgi:hypothetical protein
MLRDTHHGAHTASARPDAVVVRASDPATADHASVVALGADGALVGRATLSRLYGARGALQLELAPTAAIALALIDMLEDGARARGLAQLELDPEHVPSATIRALRRSRPTHERRRGTHLHLTWPTTHALETS